MADLTSALQQIQKLRIAYTAQIAEKLAQLQAGRQGLEQLPWNPQRAVSLHRQAHNLAGSGATFGYTELSQAARSLELALLPLCDHRLPPEAEQLVLIDTALTTLFTVGLALKASDAQEPHAGPQPARTMTRTQTLVVTDDDMEASENLSIQLDYFGYTVHTVSALDTLSTVARKVAPAAIILDLTRPEADYAGTVRALHDQGHIPAPIIFLSQRSDFAARLQAVRAGGSAFVLKPVDVSDLVLILDLLTHVVPPEPYRVLIVDDSVLVARAHALILRAAGMQVGVVSDPTEVLSVLAEQQPDLVLMDMYMPDCKGHELAAIIRQQATFHGMPIVFLSAETNREIQLAAMGHGGDDFLTKPVAPAHLVAAVKSRVERARAIRGQLNRDSLTGLLTHAATTEQIGRELARVQRYQGKLSVAMLDVDHFKRVNDRYGHSTGDRVLKSLARLLRQQLRASDVIGRYGGEEFVVLLPETDSAHALSVLERIRELFAQIQHQTVGATFTVTFSAGIASIPPFGDRNAVLEAADAALYGAKQSGRNRVLLAEMLDPSQLSKAVAATQHTTSSLDFGPSMRHTNGSLLKALIVDDDSELRAVLAHWLNGWGWTVTSVTNGPAALAQLDQTSLDVVLLDVLMPGLGGLEVLGQIRAQAFDVAVIMLTAFSSEQLAISALRQGADDYVRKPLEPTELRAVLERTLSRLRLVRENAILQRRLTEVLARST